jgi:cytochrome c553
MNIHRRSYFALMALPMLAMLLIVTQRTQAQENAADTEDVAERIGSGNPIAGEGKAVVCQSCHGKQGISTQADVPRLAGPYADYTLKQVQSFAAGVRRHPSLGKISDADVADISAWFASRPAAASSAAVADVAAAKFFTAGDRSRDVLPCVSCHGATAKGAFSGSDSIPALAGQSAPYLREQLRKFRSGERVNGVMNIVAKSLSDAEIEALSNYLSGL